MARTITRGESKARMDLAVDAVSDAYAALKADAPSLLSKDRSRHYEALSDVSTALGDLLRAREVLHRG